MPKRRREPRAIARWRFEQIEEAIGLSRDACGPLLGRIAKSPVRWLSGSVRPVSRASLYRWMDLYERAGLKALWPKPRKDRGTQKARLPADVVRKAAALLAEDEELTFTLLLALLHADPELRLAARGIQVARSTLQRHLSADHRYARLQRSRKLKRRRGRFVARRVHEIWHVDAKGPVSVRLTSGERIAFHVITIIDDASRAVLAAIVVLRPDLCAAVRVFRLAAKRWGLPDLLYADRASIFDSWAFREGLAQFGTHRIRVRPRNPEANGKIEAYHRVLVAWFTGRLGHQRVIDLVHLQQLLDGMIEKVYQDHRHRSLKCTPRQALKGQISLRTLSASRLDDAFKQERKLKSHPKTGEVELSGGTYLVPDRLRGQRLTFLIDPEPRVAPLLVDPRTDKPLPLVRAKITMADHTPQNGVGVEDASPPPVTRWGQGPLQTLYDAWQGQHRPVAEPGFGLPEIFVILAEAAGRPVPKTDAEARLIQRAYQAMGPLSKKATESAFREIRLELGTGRPIRTYLDALQKRLIAHSPSTLHKKRRHP